MMAPPDIQGILFDLDGTLLDTAPDLMAALNMLRAEEGLDAVPDGHLRSVVSHGSAAMIQRGFDMSPGDTAFEELRQRFLGHYRNCVSQRTRPFAGMSELLDELDQRQTPWGVVTNKPGWLTEPLLQDLALAERSACVISGDTLPCRKPDPAPVKLACEQLGVSPERCVLVGDALRDVVAGQRAGTWTMVALFGYIGGEDQVSLWGADGLLGHPLDLIRWLEPAPHGHRAALPSAANG